MAPSPTNPKVIAELAAEQQLVQRLFGMAPRLHLYPMGEEYSWDCVVGDPDKAPGGLYALHVIVDRRGRWVQIISRDRNAMQKNKRGDWRMGGVKLLDTMLPGGTFEQAVEVVHTFVQELGRAP